MPKDLDRVNRSFRVGGIQSVVVLAVLLGGAVFFMLPPLVKSSYGTGGIVRVALGVAIIGFVVIVHGRGALQALGTHVTAERFSRRALGEDTTIAWCDVVRVRFDSRAIVLERRGAEPVTVSLLYVNRPDVVREAIFSLVPVAALRGPDA